MGGAGAGGVGVGFVVEIAIGVTRDSITIVLCNTRIVNIVEII